MQILCLSGNLYRGINQKIGEEKEQPKNISIFHLGKIEIFSVSLHIPNSCPTKAKFHFSLFLISVGGFLLCLEIFFHADSLLPQCQSPYGSLTPAACGKQDPRTSCGGGEERQRQPGVLGAKGVEGRHGWRIGGEAWRIAGRGNHPNPTPPMTHSCLGFSGRVEAGHGLAKGGQKTGPFSSCAPGYFGLNPRPPSRCWH